MLAGKPSDAVVTISPSATVRDLIALLAAHNIGAAVVSDDGVRVVGIASERDVVRSLAQGESVLTAPVTQIMTATVQVCDPSDTLAEVRETMTAGRFRHLPVVVDDALVGVVSIGDVVKNHIDQLQFERDQLDSYVHQS